MWTLAVLLVINWEKVQIERYALYGVDEMNVFCEIALNCCVVYWLQFWTVRVYDYYHIPRHCIVIHTLTEYKARSSSFKWCTRAWCTEALLTSFLITHSLFLRMSTKLFPSFEFMKISVKNLKEWSLWRHLSFNSKVNNFFKSTLHDYALNATDLTGSIFMATNYKSSSISKLFPSCTECLLLPLFYFVHSALYTLHVVYETSFVFFS